MEKVIQEYALQCISVIVIFIKTIVLEDPVKSLIIYHHNSHRAEIHIFECGKAKGRIGYVRIGRLCIGILRFLK